MVFYIGVFELEGLGHVLELLVLVGLPLKLLLFLLYLLGVLFCCYLFLLLFFFFCCLLFCFVVLVPPLFSPLLKFNEIIFF